MVERVNYQEKTFTTDGGQVFNLRPVSTLMLSRIQKEVAAAQPQPPLVEVESPDGGVRQERNPNDPEYKQALVAWRNNEATRLMFYAWTMGIADDPPHGDVERIQEFFPHATKLEIKYFWVVELLGDNTDQWEALTEAIVSQSEVTRQGLADSMASFRRNGESDADSAGGAEEPPGSDHVQY